ENQRVADRYQRVGSAKHETVDELLVEHAGPSGRVGCLDGPRRCGNASGCLRDPHGQCVPPAKSCATPDAATRALRRGAAALRLRPTNRGMPAVTTAPIAAMSPCLMAASAVFCVPPSGASIRTMSAALPGKSSPLFKP